jgi:hypothetical protein
MTSSDLIRFFFAILAPSIALILVIRSLLHTRRVSGKAPQEDQPCIRCGQHNPGDIGQFLYSKAPGKLFRRSLMIQKLHKDAPILDSESHFVCNRCAHRQIALEILQIGVMLLPYPVYLYVILPLLAPSGGKSIFLIEALLVIFVLGGLIAAFGLFRAVRSGETPLSETRDRVAITVRMPVIGKHYNYFTRIGTLFLK